MGQSFGRNRLTRGPVSHQWVAGQRTLFPAEGAHVQIKAYSFEEMICYGFSIVKENALV